MAKWTYYLQRGFCSFRCRRHGPPFDPSNEVRERVAVVATVRRGHTGRESSTSLEDRLAADWSEISPSRIGFHTHAGACHFLDVLARVPTTSIEGTCFRARLDDGRIRGWRDMGPPKWWQTRRQGRYNRTFRPVLYLSTSRAGALSEVRQASSQLAFVQEYTLPGELRIADFATSAAPAFAHSVFDRTEQARVPGRTGLDHFLFGHAVAAITASAGFDGMLVCGVLGEVGGHYQNVILFAPGRRWRGWSRQEVGFSEAEPGAS